MDGDILLSIGGSIIYPKQGININFLKEFNIFIREKIAGQKNRRFFIMTGGGSVSEQYKNAYLKVIKNPQEEDLDWLGVRSTRLNAHLLRTIFEDISAPRIIEHYNNINNLVKSKSKVYICAAEYPGASTDWFLVTLAQRLKVKKVYSLLNVKMLYDKNPQRYTDAEPIKKIGWREYRKMIGEFWTSRRQLPFDPLSARYAEQIGLTVVLLSGHDLPNLNKALSNKPFIGTTIYNSNNYFVDYE